VWKGQRLSGGSVYSTPFGRNPSTGLFLLASTPLFPLSAGCANSRNSKGKQKLREQRQMSSSRQLDRTTWAQGEAALEKGAFGPDPKEPVSWDSFVNRNWAHRMGSPHIPDPRNGPLTLHKEK